MTDERETTTLPGQKPGEQVDEGTEVLDGEVVQESSADEGAQEGLGGNDAPEAQVLDDLKRLQDDLLLARADYQNLAKQSAKRQSDAAQRAKARVVEGLLPVLDSFEAAAKHSNDVEGLEVLFKQLTQALAQQGLEEIPAEGKPFDPTLHEAVHMVEDPAVDQAVVKEVYRKGYQVGGQLLRPASVVVASPAEDAEG
jgi:molecular chaperone GrpE